MFEIILLAVAGTCGGIITGIIPGIHPNTLAAFMLAMSPFLLFLLQPLAVAVFIVSVLITHTFLSFIPAVFLGAPEEESALTLLPGHKMLLAGRGYEAVYLTVVGGIGVIILSFILLPFVLVFIPLVYTTIKYYISYLLLFVVLVMILTEKEKKAKGAAVFLLSGILGFVVLNSPAFPANQILFPVFTGLFGTSTLIISSMSRFSIPEQKTNSIKTDKKTALKGVWKGLFSGSIVGILPGIGPSQAGVLVYETSTKKSVNEFLVSLGAINTIAAFFSFITLFVIKRPRSGAAVAVEKILGIPDLQAFMTIAFAVLFSAGLGAIATLFITKKFAKLIEKTNYRRLSFYVIALLCLLVFVLTGFRGLLILATSTAIGMIPPLTGVKRTHTMGVLILPIILFFINL